MSFRPKTHELCASSLRKVMSASSEAKAYFDLVIVRYLESILCRAVWVGEMAIGAAAHDGEAQFATAYAQLTDRYAGFH